MQALMTRNVDFNNFCYAYRELEQECEIKIDRDNSFEAQIAPRDASEPNAQFNVIQNQGR